VRVEECGANAARPRPAYLVIVRLQRHPARTRAREQISRTGIRLRPIFCYEIKRFKGRSGLDRQ